MSGILGFYSEQNPSQHETVLKHMQEAVSHRGPDGLGHWIDGSVAIGHQRFITTPEAEYERSPHINGDGYVITADVRLDNRDELIESLGLTNLPPEKITDPALIIQAYQKWGNRSPDKLLGAFAFLLWDPLQQKFFGARDHMGVKPFYYCQKDGFFACASEIKALLRSPQVSDELNQLRIIELLTSQLRDNQRTCYQDIVRLPAAHWLEFHPHEPFQIEQYWQLNPQREVTFSNDEEYVQAFQRIFDQAVQCRLRHKGSIGAHLSGGLDSSSIAVTAEKLLETSDSQTQLHTFSATFLSVPECDESEYVQDIIAGRNFEPHFIPADQTGPLSHWQELFHALDEPAIGNGYLTWLMNQTAHQNGIKILLNGYDGDTTVGHGTLYPNELARAGQWKQALEEARLLAQRLSVTGLPPLKLMRRISYEVLIEYRKKQKWREIITAIPQIFRPLKLSPWKLSYIFILRPWLRNLLRRKTAKPQANPAFDTQLQLLHSNLRTQWLTHQEAKPQDISSAEKTVRYEQWSILSSGMMTFPMELLDHISSPLAIEPRFPLMDKRLVEFCLALPANQKLRQGWTRLILRKSMESRLPSNVQWREAKTQFTQAFDEKLISQNQDILNEIFNAGLERLTHWVDAKTLKQTLAEGFTSTTISDLWPLITLSLWLRHKAQTSHLSTGVFIKNRSSKEA